MRVLHDDDVAALAPAEAVATMERVVRSHAAGDLRAPPRCALDTFGEGDLVFTCGATPEAIGFRVHETLGRGEGHTQFTAG
jgi:hypothetical protein